MSHNFEVIAYEQTVDVYTRNIRTGRKNYLPELGEGLSLDKRSRAAPRRSGCSKVKEDDCTAAGDAASWKLDSGDPVSDPTGSKTWALNSSGFSSIVAFVSKYGDSNAFSGCSLRKLSRTSHWINFS